MQNASECVNMICKHLKKDGLSVQKNYEKKRKIMESEVKQGALKELKIDMLLARIQSFERALDEEPTNEVVQNLMQLYNKAIEYYSALGDERHHDYLLKLQGLFTDKRVQEIAKKELLRAESEEESKMVN